LQVACQVLLAMAVSTGGRDGEIRLRPGPALSMAKLLANADGNLGADRAK